MGADLYIKTMEREKQYRGFEVSKEAVDVGYFRDCYNPNGLMNFLRSNVEGEFSWWKWANEKRGEWLRDDPDEGLIMTVKGAIEFRAEMLKARNKINAKEELRMRRDVFEKRAGDTTKQFYENYDPMTEKEVKEYKDWLDLLIKFLSLAIDQESEIIWCV